MPSLDFLVTCNATQEMSENHYRYRVATMCFKRATPFLFGSSEPSPIEKTVTLSLGNSKKKA